MAAIAEQGVHFSLNYLTLFSEIEVQNETREIAQQKDEFLKLKARILPYLDAFENPDWFSNISSFHSKETLLSGLSAPMAVSRAARISESMDRVRGSYDELGELRNRLNASLLERSRVYLAPFLVAFALAVRFGKTTAEIRRKKSQANKG